VGKVEVELIGADLGSNNHLSSSCLPLPMVLVFTHKCFPHLRLVLFLFHPTRYLPSGSNMEEDTPSRSSLISSLGHGSNLGCPHHLGRSNNSKQLRSKVGLNPPRRGEIKNNNPRIRRSTNLQKMMENLKMGDLFSLLVLDPQLLRKLINMLKWFATNVVNQVTTRLLA
jgi:hypothetical protein